MRSDESLTMPNQREDISLLAVCAIFLVLSVAGLAAAFITRLITSIDGLLLIMICLMMGGLFTLMLVSVAKDAGWLPSGKKKSDAAASAKPGEGK
jgi:hypothetical protein